MSRKYRFAVAIQTIFIVIFSVVFMAMTAYNFVKGEEVVLEAGQELLEEVGLNVIEQLLAVYRHPADIIEDLPMLIGRTQKPKGIIRPELTLFVHMLNVNKNIFSIYQGWSNGDFYQIIKTRGESRLIQEFNAPSETEYIITSITNNSDNNRISTVAFFDNKINQIDSSLTKAAQYDPRERLWYVEGRNRPTGYRTQNYKFKTLNALGASVTTPFTDDIGGVLGVDVRLDHLAEFLKQKKPGKDGRIVVFSEDGTILAHENTQYSKWTEGTLETSEVHAAKVDKIGDNVLAALYSAYKQGKTTDGEAFSFEVDENTYLAEIATHMHTPGTDRVVAIVAPTSHFTHKINSIARKNILISLLLSGIGFAFVVFASRKLSSSLKDLSNEADTIRGFDLSQPRVPVKSQIKEIANLANSIASMRTGIKSFTQYLSKDLVQYYIQTGKEPTIGGDRRVVTLLFSDISGFTTLSEPIEPERLIRLMSGYFEEVGGIVSNCGGMIDKYIGDSLMAIWNAPEKRSDHIEKACEAALRSSKAVSEFEFEDEVSKFSGMATRFGLFCGEAVVGNVGSPDRINYTAFGASVNLASRLEGLNKYYGTTILVNQTIREKAHKEFIFRSVDRVKPKGALEPISVYELVGTAGKGRLPNMAVSKRQIDEIERWEKAYEMYHAQRWKEALEIFEGLQDGNGFLKSVYVQRIHELLENPPKSDWDGVTVMKSK